MTFLPIVDRELRVTARLSATYRNRSLTAGVVAFVAIIMLMFGAFSNSPSMIGRSMFATLSFLTLLFCMFEGVRKTSDCLSEEKREGTLGLLFLTDLKGYDVVLGKLSGALLNSLYGLFSILPVLALPLLLGGVMPGEFWRMVLALANILFFSLSAGMWVSAYCRNETSAMINTFLFLSLMAALLVFNRLHAAFHLNPFYSFMASSRSGDYWRSIISAQFLSWMLLAWASFVVPRSWQKEKIAASSFRALVWRPNKAKVAQLRSRMLDNNPVLWLASRNADLRFTMFTLMAFAGTASFALMFKFDWQFLPLGVIWLVNFCLKMRLAAESTRCFAEARRNNALEMLLATPLSVEDIIRGQIRALHRHFLKPTFIILSLEMIGTTVAFFRNVDSNSQIFGWAFFLLGVAGYLVIFFLDVFSVIWAGMWFGLSAKNQAQAVTRTILFTLVLPLFSVLICYGMPFALAVPIFWIFWGRHKVRFEFRNIAARRFDAPRAETPRLKPALKPL